MKPKKIKELTESLWNEFAEIINDRETAMYRECFAEAIQKAAIAIETELKPKSHNFPEIDLHQLPDTREEFNKLWGDMQFPVFTKEEALKKQQEYFDEIERRGDKIKNNKK